jgi:hypothetical protein
MGTGPGCVELPAVVRALKTALSHAAQGQARAAMRASVGQQDRLVSRSAPQHQRLPQQLQGLGPVAPFVGHGDRPPPVSFAM